MPAVSTLSAKDIMTPEPVCIDPGTDMREVARLFATEGVSGAPVLDSNGAVAGIVSMSDIIRQLVDGTPDVLPAYLFDAMREQSSGEREGIEAEPEVVVPVEDFMTEGAATVSPDTPIAEVAKIMHRDRIHRVVVVDGGNFPLGIITSLDLVGAMAKQR